MKNLTVTCWNEQAENQYAYPEGIHKCIAGFLQGACCIGEVRTVSLDMPEQGLPQEVLDTTDVLVYWGHAHHAKVTDETVRCIKNRVLDGMGLVLLHSAHASKIFQTLMGTRTEKLAWRLQENEWEKVWKIEANHPVTRGVPDCIYIPQTEMYGEPFGIPAPDELLFISGYGQGEVFRSGCTYKRGAGNIFYFAPGHETYRIYDMPEIQQIIKNAVRWAAKR